MILTDDEEKENEKEERTIFLVLNEPLRKMIDLNESTYEDDLKLT